MDVVEFWRFQVLFKTKKEEEAEHIKNLKHK